MEKLAFFAFVLSPGVLFAFLRVPETPTLASTLTFAARAPCEVAAYPSSADAPNVAAGHAARSVRLAAR